MTLPDSPLYYYCSTEEDLQFAFTNEQKHSAVLFCVSNLVFADLKYHTNGIKDALVLMLDD